MLPPEELRLFQIPVKVISLRCQQPPPGLGTAASAMINSSSISPGAAAAFPLQPRGPSPSCCSPPMLCSSPSPLEQLPPSPTSLPSPLTAVRLPSPLPQPQAPRNSSSSHSSCSHPPSSMSAHSPTPAATALQGASLCASPPEPQPASVSPVPTTWSLLLSFLHTPRWLLAAVPCSPPHPGCLAPGTAMLSLTCVALRMFQPLPAPRPACPPSPARLPQLSSILWRRLAL